MTEFRDTVRSNLYSLCGGVAAAVSDWLRVILIYAAFTSLRKKTLRMVVRSGVTFD